MFVYETAISESVGWKDFRVYTLLCGVVSYNPPLRAKPLSGEFKPKQWSNKVLY